MKRTWPDGTPKSYGNAFDWRSRVSRIANSTEFKQSQHSTAVMAGKGDSKTFTIYSRAKPKGKA